MPSDAAVMARTKPRCPLCGDRYNPEGGRKGVTRDHIYPKAWGGQDTLHGGAVRNIRPMCQACNSLRGMVGHCVGAAACVLAVSNRRQRSPPGVVCIRWGMAQVQRDMDTQHSMSLYHRVQRATAALDTAPDVDPAKATRAEVAATHAANLKAWTILTEGRDPPSRRGAGAGETAVGAINSGGGVADV